MRDAHLDHDVIDGHALRLHDVINLALPLHDLLALYLHRRIVILEIALELGISPRNLLNLALHCDDVELRLLQVDTA